MQTEEIKRKKLYDYLSTDEASKKFDSHRTADLEYGIDHSS